MVSAEPLEPMHLDRYVLHAPIASGGMASVHLGRVKGARGFARTVAIKRLHPQFARDPEFSSMLLDEARVASAIRHLNVVPTLDVVQAEDELFMVMEYVPGESLARLIAESRARSVRVPAPIAAAILAGALEGLHAAHEARSEEGVDLQIVHRDVSPQNILVGRDGIPRLLDFGIARAAVRAQATREGQLKGKLRYMAPEQLRGRRDVDRRTDVYAAGVVLWEVLTGEKLFNGESEAEVFGNVLEGVVPPPSTLVGLPAGVDQVVLRALTRAPGERYATALEMAEALVAALPPASPAEVGVWVDGLVGDVLAERARALAALEEPRESVPPASSPSSSAHGERVDAPPLSVSRARRAAPAVSLATQTLTAAALPDARSVLKPVALELPALKVRQFQAAPHPRRSGLWIGGGVSLLAGALAALFALRRSGGVAPDPAPVATAVEVAASERHAEPSPAPSAAPASPPEPPPSPSSAPAPSNALFPSMTHPPRARPRCVPPYYVDSTGIRRVKRDCF